MTPESRLLRAAPVRPDAGPAGARPRLLAGGRGAARSGSTPTADTPSPSTGHSHPDVVRAIAEQASALLFYSTRGAASATAEELAERLAALCPDPAGPGLLLQLRRGGQRERPPPGAEAHRPADDRLRARGLARPDRGHAGRAPTVSATRTAARRAGMPLSPQGALRRHRRARGRGGRLGRRAASSSRCRASPARATAPPEFLAAARRICAERGRGAHLRRGAVRRRPVRRLQRRRGVRRRRPTSLTFAKGLAAGLPIGAVVATPAVTAALTLGDLGSTFGGGPGALRRGARHPRGDRAGGADRERGRGRRAPRARRARARRVRGSGARAAARSPPRAPGRRRCSARCSASGS